MKVQAAEPSYSMKNKPTNQSVLRNWNGTFGWIGGWKYHAMDDYFSQPHFTM